MVTSWVGSWVIRVFFGLPYPPLELFLRKVIDPSFILLCVRAARSKSWGNFRQSPSTIASLMGPCRLSITICTASSSYMFHFALAAKFLHRLTKVMNSKPGRIFSFTKSQRLGDVPPGGTTGWWICQSHRQKLRRASRGRNEFYLSASPSKALIQRWKNNPDWESRPRQSPQKDSKWWYGSPTPLYLLNFGILNPSESDSLMNLFRGLSDCPFMKEGAGVLCIRRGGQGRGISMWWMDAWKGSMKLSSRSDFFYDYRFPFGWMANSFHSRWEGKDGSISSWQALFLPFCLAVSFVCIGRPNRLSHH